MKEKPIHTQLIPSVYLPIYSSPIYSNCSQFNQLQTSKVPGGGGGGFQFGGWGSQSDPCCGISQTRVGSMGFA